jgi:hypothetical protein
MNGKVLLGVVGGAAIFAGAVWLVTHRDQTPSENGVGGGRAPAAGRSGLGTPSAGAGAVDPAALEAVRAIVKAKNALEPREADTFRARGWTMVSVPPPDQRLLALDPALLATREPELRVQIASNTASPAEVPNLAAIARQAHDPHTRFVAVEALGRVSGPEAQRALRSLLLDKNFAGGDADDPARRQVPALLRPSALDDPWAAELAALLDAPGLDPAARKQIAFTLALVGLRDGMTLAPEVLARLSPAARALVDQMTQLAVAGGLPGGSSHHDVGPLAHAHDHAHEGGTP